MIRRAAVRSLPLLVLLLGACASGGVARAHVGTPSLAQTSSRTVALRTPHGESTAGALSTEREPSALSGGMERGIPTPQPARDPGASAMGPVPQPPLPGPGDPRRVSGPARPW